MKTYKISVKFIVMTVFMIAIAVLAVSVGASMIREDGIDGENGMLGVLFLVVGASYVWSAWMLLMQMIVDKGIGMRLTEEGIEQTFVCVNLLAFMFVAPVSFIPWSAIGEISERQGFYSAPVETDKVQAGFMGKFLLKLAGFGFGSGMVKPSVKREEIRRYSGK